MLFVEAGKPKCGRGHDRLTHACMMGAGSLICLAVALGKLVDR